jgi:hypothetical protein
VRSGRKSRRGQQGRETRVQDDSSEDKVRGVILMIELLNELSHIDRGDVSTDNDVLTIP